MYDIHLDCILLLYVIKGDFTILLLNWNTTYWNICFKLYNGSYLWHHYIHHSASCWQICLLMSIPLITQCILVRPLYWIELTGLDTPHILTVSSKPKYWLNANMALSSCSLRARSNMTRFVLHLVYFGTFSHPLPFSLSVLKKFI